MLCCLIEFYDVLCRTGFQLPKQQVTAFQSDSVGVSLTPSLSNQNHPKPRHCIAAMSDEYNKLKSDTYKKLAEKHGRRPTVGKFLTELNQPFGAVSASVEWRNASFNVQFNSDDAWLYMALSCFII